MVILFGKRRCGKAGDPELVKLGLEGPRAALPTAKYWVSQVRERISVRGREARQGAIIWPGICETQYLVFTVTMSIGRSTPTRDNLAKKLSTVSRDVASHSQIPHFIGQAPLGSALRANTKSAPSRGGALLLFTFVESDQKVIFIPKWICRWPIVDGPLNAPAAPEVCEGRANPVASVVVRPASSTKGSMLMKLGWFHRLMNDT